MAADQQSGSVIVLEFNELSHVLVDRFIAQGKLPNFARFRRESVVCVTDAEEKPPTLEPWIQWVTVHTGKAYAEHRVFEHTDGAKCTAARIWDFLSDAGRSVWICGSMNVAAKDGRVKGYLLPDPWSDGVAPLPANEFEPYHHFISTYVKAHAAAHVPLSARDYLRFAYFMATRGLSFRTLSLTVRQLLAEQRKDVKWARAFIMDRLQMDVFKHYWKRNKPKFSTFFLNSTAHMQHFHWRDMEPDLFEVKPSEEARRIYANAILSGYENMDRLLGETLAMAGDKAHVVLATALSQQPMTTYEEIGGKLLHKPADPAAIAAFAGVTAPFTVLPAMSNQFFLEFANEAEAIDASDKLNALTTSNDEKLIYARPSENKISMVCAIRWPVSQDTTLRSPLSNAAPRFYDAYFPIGLRSGCHHPDGMFWVRTPQKRHALVSRKVSIREIAPTLMALCGVRAASDAFDFPPMPELAGAA